MMMDPVASRNTMDAINLGLSSMQDQAREKRGLDQLLARIAELERRVAALEATAEEPRV